ncbi:MAG: hypothetical protein AAFO73_07690 [Pseudomonadota bacterium]
MPDAQDKKPDPKLFFETDRFQKAALIVLVALALVLFALEFTGLRYGYTEADKIPAFYILYAGVGAALVGFASVAFRKLFLRGKTFYGERGVESEKHPLEDLDERLDRDA